MSIKISDIIETKYCCCNHQNAHVINIIIIIRIQIKMQRVKIKRMKDKIPEDPRSLFS